MLRAAVLFLSLMAALASSMENYVVMFRKGATKDQIQSILEGVKASGGEVKQHFSLISGFSAKLSAEHAEQLKEHPDVTSIEHDGEVHMMG